MKTASFKSNYALIDVKHGRVSLLKKIKKGPVKIRVDMLLTEQHGNDDGASIEFSGEVLSVKEFA